MKAVDLEIGGITRARFQEEMRWLDQTSMELLEQYRQNKDLAFRNRIVLLHHRLVRFAAFQFTGSWDDFQDLQQEGYLALIKIVERFDVARGTKFSTYAMPSLQGEIKNYLRDNTCALKVPRRMYELNQVIERNDEQLAQELGHEPTVLEIAVALGVPEEDVTEALIARQALFPRSLDAPEEEDEELHSFVGSIDPALKFTEEKVNYPRLTQAVQALEPRYQEVVYYRYECDLSQDSIARFLNCSQMQVSRLLSKALERLRELLGTPEALAVPERS